MKLLVIGGTRFYGRHFVTAALERGHELTLFNRGKQAPASPEVETIHGDRTSDLAKLHGRRWDAVVDTCGFLPRTVEASAEVLRDAVDVYVFVSSQSVYADMSRPGNDENSPIDVLRDEQLTAANAIDPSQVTAASLGNLYGGLKALCEEAAEEVIGRDRVLALRPGLIVGPNDYTDRFTYWVARVARGGEVLAPGDPQRHVQFIDSRDLAEWTIGMIERKQTGIYNCNGLPGAITMGQLLDECKVVSGSDASFTWVDEDFLLQEQVGPWSELPLWLPDVPTLKGFMYVNSDRAIEAGLTFRPLTQTIADTLSWYQTTSTNEAMKAGLSAEKEQDLLNRCEHSKEK